MEVEKSNENQLGTAREGAPRPQEIELLAFEFWLDRGSPIGSPEVDWFRAEEELKRTDKPGEDSLTRLSTGIGSAVGAIVAHLADALAEASSE
jgi:Protein of unknown function (DUF2934)